MKSKFEKLIVMLVMLATGISVDMVNAELVALWELDESSGTIAHDLLGDKDGMLWGSLDWQTYGGVIGGALKFNGTNGYVQISNYNGITGTQSRTVSAWIKTDTFGFILHWGEGRRGELWCFWVQNDQGTNGAIRAGVLGGGIVGNTDLRDGQWHHVVAALKDDGSANIDEVKLYVDGKLENISAVSSRAINTISSDSVKIGKLNLSGDELYFNGLIDDVAIFDHALSEDEITQLYTLGAASFISEPMLQTLLKAVQQAQALIKEQKYQQAITFLEKTITEGEQRLSKSSSGIKELYNRVFLELSFQLAKAKELAGFPKKDVIAAYKHAIFSPGQGGAALMWLFENVPTDQYKDVVRTYIQNNADKPPYIIRQFEANGNWPAFKQLLDVAFKEAKDPVGIAKVVEGGLSRNSGWTDKYIKYCREKPNLAQYILEKDSKTAEAYAANGEFKKAAEVYRSIIKRSGANQQKAALEFKIYEYLLEAGDYQAVLFKLDRFIAKNKATNRSLTKEAILMKGRAYIQLGEIDKAINEFFTLTIEYPETQEAPESSFFIGYCHMLQGKFEEAKEALGIVVKDYPQSSYASRAKLCLIRIESMAE